MQYMHGSKHSRASTKNRLGSRRMGQTPRPFLLAVLLIFSAGTAIAFQVSSVPFVGGRSGLSLRPTLDAPWTMKAKASSKRGPGFGQKTSGGFGSKPQKGAKVQSEVAQVLKKVGGDIGSAHALLFQKQIENIKLGEPEVYLAMQREMQAVQQDANNVPSAEIHERLVEVTWDTIASFLPLTSVQAGQLDPRVTRKMESIAQACLPAPATSILDVGCGDAMIVKFLKKMGAREELYTGIDLSGQMVEAAKGSFRRARFQKANFLKFDPEERFETILFNGSLQFFADVKLTLQKARSLLRPGGRVVIAHANGASFVEEERQKNPVTVTTTMPPIEWFEREVDELGFAVLRPEELVETQDDIDLSEFYLAGLRLQRQ